MHKSKARHKPIARKHYTHHYDLYDRLEDIQHSLAKVTKNVKDKTSDIIANSIYSAKAQGKLVGKFIKKRPYRSAGVVALILLCVGFLIRRR